MDEIDKVIVWLGGAELAPLCNAEFGAEPDCDCPSEHWHVGSAGACLEMHLEPDGSAHCAIFAGDWETEAGFQNISDIEALRSIAFRWAAEALKAAMQERRP
jgi:hypothetical protein